MTKHEARSEAVVFGTWRTRWLATAAVAIICASFLARAAGLAEANWDSMWWDQAGYLDLGRSIAQGGGITDGNRHPLYPALIAPFYTPDLAYFSTSKLVSVALGTAGLIVMFFVARRFVGAAAAILFLGVMATNGELLVAAGSVDVECLLIPLHFVLWWLSLRALEDDSSRPVVRASVAGVACGVAYLAKGTAPIWIACFLTALALGRPHTARMRRGASYLGAFLVTAAPLLATKWAMFGNPFYNIASTNMFWADRFDEIFAETREQLPTFGTYVRSHSLHDAVTRLADGLAASPFQWFNALRPGEVDAAPLWGPLLVVGLALLVGFSLLRGSNASAGRRAMVLFTIPLCVAYTVLFAWYRPVDASARFLAVLAPVCLVGVAAAIEKTLRNHRRWVVVSAVVVTLAAALQLAVEWRQIPALWRMKDSDRFRNSRSVAVIETVHAVSQKDDAVLAGPLAGVPVWLLEDRRAVYIPITITTTDALAGWAAKEGVRAAIVDTTLIRRRPELAGAIWTERDGYLQPRALLPGWRLVDPASHPCRVCVYVIDSPPPGFSPEP